METNLHVFARTHSISYVTVYILKYLQWIISGIGLDDGRLSKDYEIYENGLRTWLDSEHLEQTTLEVYNSSATFVGRFDFTIRYDWETGESLIWGDEEQIETAIKKAGIVSESLNWDIIVTNMYGNPTVAGWSPCSALLTKSMVRQGLGAGIEKKGLGANVSYWWLT